jgi:TPR repeat protein
MNSLPVDSLDRRWQAAIDCFNTGDHAGALFLLRTLAEQGHWPAYVELGNLYEIGAANVQQDFQEAARWYRRAIAEADDVHAHLALGRLLLNGQGVERNYSEAYQHLRKAGDEPMAWIMLGLMFHFAHGVDRDFEKARRLYKDAAAKQYVIGLRLLSRLEADTGHHLRSVIIKARSIYLAFRIATKNPHDRRLGGLNVPPIGQFEHVTKVA